MDTELVIAKMKIDVYKMELDLLRGKINELCGELYSKGMSLTEIYKFNAIFALKKYREENDCSLTEAHQFFKSQNCVG